MSTTLSVNINKVATLRNARGGDLPDLLHFARTCERCGADGITVHPRPDERHIRRSDVFALCPILTTQLNIEGYPSEEFLSLVLQVLPTQVTLVPDAPSQLTSDHGWDTVVNREFLTSMVEKFRMVGIRTSIFIDPTVEMVEGAFACGADRIELYTEPYCSHFSQDKNAAIAPYVEAAARAQSLGLGINAGHGLDLETLPFLVEKIPFIDEVSIGHALIADALYLGIEETIKRYKDCLK